VTAARYSFSLKALFNEGYSEFMPEVDFCHIGDLGHMQKGM
jgi:hypothetical protein